MRASGTDQKKLAQQSALMMTSHRALMMRIGVLLDGLVLTIAPALTPFIQDLTAWLKENKDSIVEFVRGFVKLAERVGEAFGRLVMGLAPVALWLDNVIHNATGERGLVVAIEALSGAFLASIVLRMARASFAVRAAIVALVATIVVGRYVAPETFGLGPREAPQGPDERPRQGFFGRAIDRVRGALGMGRPSRPGRSGAHGSAGKAGTGDSGPAHDRSSFSDELNDPKVKAAVLAMVDAEVGEQPGAQQHVMETLFNRAKSRHQTLMQALGFGAPKYYAGATYAAMPGLMNDPDRLNKKYEKIWNAVMAGSNVSHSATGNSSDGVGFNNGPKTATVDGEDIGVEGPDIPWSRRAEEEAKALAAKKAKDLSDLLDRLSKLKPLLSPDERDEMRMKTPWGKPDGKLSSGPLINDADDFGVTTNRTTKITVHGDTNPHRTAEDVAFHQSRINTDMITSTERAFA